MPGGTDYFLIGLALAVALGGAAVGARRYCISGGGGRSKGKAQGGGKAGKSATTLLSHIQRLPRAEQLKQGGAQFEVKNPLRTKANRKQ